MALYYYCFYVFFRREPEDIKSIDADRDVFNERPSKEDIISSTEAACKLIVIYVYVLLRLDVNC